MVDRVLGTVFSILVLFRSVASPPHIIGGACVCRSSSPTISAEWIFIEPTSTEIHHNAIIRSSVSTLYLFCVCNALVHPHVICIGRTYQKRFLYHFTLVAFAFSIEHVCALRFLYEKCVNKTHGDTSRWKHLPILRDHFYFITFSWFTIIIFYFRSFFFLLANTHLWLFSHHRSPMCNGVPYARDDMTHNNTQNRTTTNRATSVAKPY